jgi:hypothetical protein
VVAASTAQASVAEATMAMVYLAPVKVATACMDGAAAVMQDILPVTFG